MKMLDKDKGYFEAHFFEAADFVRAAALRHELYRLSLERNPSPLISARIAELKDFRACQEVRRAIDRLRLELDQVQTQRAISVWYGDGGNDPLLVRQEINIFFCLMLFEARERTLIQIEIINDYLREKNNG